MARIPRPEVECPNCGASLTATPCPVCGHWPKERGGYPIGHDRLTDSYQAPKPDPADTIQTDDALWARARGEGA